MTENNSKDYKNYNKEKQQKFISLCEQHLKDIERCSDIIFQLETEQNLSLNEKDVLKLELGNKVDKVKSDSQDIVDTLITEYQLYDATAPRITQNLSGFKMLEEKVVNKNKDYRVSEEEAQNDNAFYFNE